MVILKQLSAKSKCQLLSRLLDDVRLFNRGPILNPSGWHVDLTNFTAQRRCPDTREMGVHTWLPQAGSKRSFHRPGIESGSRQSRVVRPSMRNHPIVFHHTGAHSSRMPFPAFITFQYLLSRAEHVASTMSRFPGSTIGSLAIRYRTNSRCATF